ncbi:type IV pilus modification PilV family protein [Dethiobacter alkaliphilus]|uniref:Prepilin-type N-terminal cleavage/methylation domain-containing protein n=1 Tax=Dethiobacter alkaliphilus AHT 1 TaxID=555088 RepID=C0GE92_DETAL|nr:prepilin-type N-terminal cleavage/methylation domain-containing protein [Dethiobacter alkaliphilus]EEG78386.1 hypothetical protein DealDRAFT_0801 [Dethiobacter alkaliphilus AHT 1]
MKKQNTEKGFSLVEVIVALAILAILVAALTPLFTFSFTNIFSGGRKSSAQYRAHEAMENKFAGIGVDEGAETTTLTIKFGETTSIDIEKKDVSVTIDYTDSQGNERNVTYNSFLPK